MCLHLFALLVCSALSYGLYLVAAMFLSPDMPTRREGGLRREIVDVIVMSIFVGGTTSFLSLLAATGAFALFYRLGWRYHASPLGQSIARLPGARLIPYIYHKYWLPSRVSPRPRPRSFYLKRFIIRQSNFSYPSHLLNPIPCSY